jgi:uncharacterized protein (TIGR03435 family)
MRLGTICNLAAALLLMTTPLLHAQSPDNGGARVWGPGSLKNGFFGPVSARPRAGDQAPDLVYSRALHSPGSSINPAPWTSADFTGQVTIIAFFPDTTDNERAVSQWNALVKQFANKPVQFVWITGEKESSLLPWLIEHPVDGWMLLDAEGETGRAYGLETPETVIVAPDRNILGFDAGMGTTRELVNAALEDRIRTAAVTSQPGGKGTMVLLQAEPQRIPDMDEHKPKFAPSYEVHITPSKGDSSSSSGGDGYWAVTGYSLKRVISETFDLGMELNRIDFPDASAAEKRYNVALILPKGESHNAMMRRVREAIEQKFSLTITPEARATEVYVVTAPNGPGPLLRPLKAAGGAGGHASEMTFAWKSKDGSAPTAKDMQEIVENGRASSPVNVQSISVQNGTIAEFCRTLESGLDRPIVDETNLTGTYDFEVDAGDRTQDQLFQMLADQLGLVLTPAVRDISMVVVRP